MHEALGFIPALHTLDVMVHTSKTSTREIEIKGLGIQGHPLQHRKLWNSLGYVRYCLKQKTYRKRMFSVINYFKTHGGVLAH